MVFLVGGNMYWSFCMTCCLISGAWCYFTDLGPLPTFSDWKIEPYTIATFGRFILKDNDGYSLRETVRNLVPKNEPIEYFKTFLKNSGVYVDKSLLIADILNEPRQLIRILRPRRWGKTLNLNMLEKFFEIETDDLGNPLDSTFRKNRQLFCGKGSRQLQICNDPYAMGEIGKYPVMSISLKGIHGKNYKDFERGVKERLTTAFQKHYYLTKYYDKNDKFLAFDAIKDRLKTLMEGDAHVIDVMYSIQFLTETLYRHYGNTSRVMLLIDDYDSPIINAFSEFGYENRRDFGEFVDFMQCIFSIGLNKNDYVEKMVLTGTYQLWLDDDFSGPTNFTNYHVLEDQRYVSRFGFTIAEVTSLIQSDEVLLEKGIDIRTVEGCYGKYNFSGVPLFHPGSVMKLLGTKVLREYLETDDNDKFFLDVLKSDISQSNIKVALAVGDLVLRGDESDMEIDLLGNYTSKSIVLLCNGIYSPKEVNLKDEIVHVNITNVQTEKFVKRILGIN